MIFFVRTLKKPVSPFTTTDGHPLVDNPILTPPSLSITYYQFCVTRDRFRARSNVLFSKVIKSLFITNSSSFLTEF